MQITDILKLPEDDLLVAIAEHLDELSGYGDAMNNLNKWEQVVYDVNALYSSIGSDGIDFYLETYGHRFSKVKKALTTVNAKKALEFLEMLEKRFPNSKVPKSLKKIELILEDILDKEDGFDKEDQFYDNECIEKELIDAEYKFILENKKMFH